MLPTAQWANTSAAEASSTSAPWPKLRRYRPKSINAEAPSPTRKACCTCAKRRVSSAIVGLGADAAGVGKFTGRAALLAAVDTVSTGTREMGRCVDALGGALWLARTDGVVGGTVTGQSCWWVTATTPPPPAKPILVASTAPSLPPGSQPS